MSDKKKLMKKILKEPGEKKTPEITETPETAPAEKKIVEGESQLSSSIQKPEGEKSVSSQYSRPEAVSSVSSSHEKVRPTTSQRPTVPPPQQPTPAQKRMPKIQEIKFFSIFPYGKVIDFLGKRKIAYFFSALLFIFSSFIIFSGNLKLSTDFKGGISADVVFQNEVNIDELRKVLTDATIQKTGDREFLIKLPIDFVESAKKEGKDAGELISEKLKMLGEFELRKVESVGAVIGKELREKGLYAAIFSLIGIFIYIVFRFEWRFALGAVIALLHDVIITTGIMNLLSVELSLVTLAGLLTLAGYSVNDSVIIADRIREKLKLSRGIWKIDTFNKAISETLSRTILTVMTTLFVVIMITLFGGDVLRDLGIVLLIGIIIGTYSSIFVVSALAFDIYNLGKKQKT